MAAHFGNLNWLAILACVVVGQVFLTVWFVALFAKPWAKEYGVEDPKQHTSEVPGYTYAIGAVCVALLSIGLGVVQSAMGVEGVLDGLMVGAFVALTFALATALPGYAFLKRYGAFSLALGSQTTLILILSTVLAAWP